MFLSSRKQCRGQGTVEYVLITALVALAAMAIFRSFRQDLAEAYHKAGQAIVSGVDAGVSAGTNEN